MRVACVIVPHIALQLVCRERPNLAQQPIIIPDPQNPRRVFDLSPAAHRCGVSPGLPVRTAVGLCPTAAIVACDAPLLSGAFASLADVMASVSPVVESLPPDTFYLDITRGHGASAELELLRTLLLAIGERTGLRTRGGSGAGRFTARIAAMLAEDGAVRVIAPGDEGATLAPLPVVLLPCSAEVERRLQLYGLRTLGDVAALPAGPLQAQFGPEGLTLWRLAAGFDTEPPRATPPPPVLTERVELPAPSADQATLMRAVALVLRRLFRRSEIGTRVARRLTVQVALEDGTAWQRTFTFHRPVADDSAALTAVRARLEGLTLTAAAVATACTLHDLCGERGEQATLTTARTHRLAQLEEALRHLRTRFDRAPVLRVVAVEPRSRIPERRLALTEYLP